MRLLLRLYPANFRREYGAQMLADFRQRRAATAGVGVVALWIDAVLDTIGNAAVVHADLLRQDLHQARRTLARAPVFAATAILVTAIGIGANTAAFSIANYVFFRPVPFPDANRLVTLWERVEGYDEMQPSPSVYRDWQRLGHSFDAVAAYHAMPVALIGGDAPQQLDGAAVDGPFFPILGVHAWIGRLPDSSEISRHAPVMVLSYSLWKEDFGGDRGVIGKQITVNGVPTVVIGVTPKRFAFPDRTVRLWTPMSAADVSDSDRTNSWFNVIARRRPGVTVAMAQAEMTRVGSALHAIWHDDADAGVHVMSMRDTYAITAPGDRGHTLLVALCGAAICVLLITCANLATLLLVRATVRRRELALRAALGAGRERLTRQLLTESLLLAMIGGVLGVALAFVAMPLLDQLVPATLPLAQPPGIDIKVLFAATVLTLVTGIGFGVLPAIRAGRMSSFDGLRDTVRTAGGRSRLRSALVMIEIAVSVVLLVGAGLLLRAMWRVEAIDPGFHTEDVMTVRTELPAYRYARTSTRTAFYQQVLSRIRAIPGVKAAGYVSWLPMEWGGGIWPVDVPPDTGFRHASLRFVTPGYLDAMRIPLLQGRDVSDGDTPAAPDAAVVSESFVQRFWPGQNPLGQHFKFAFADRTVVGVVHDIHVRGLERESEPQVYLPYQQVPDSSLTFYAPRDLAIRSTLPPGALVPLVRRSIREADPEQAIDNVQPLSAVVSAQVLSRAVQARVLTLFAVIAFLLAAIGLHGLLAFAVSQRRQEMAIRLALGADQSRVLRMILRHAMVLTLGGIVPGVLAAVAAGKAMTAALAGVSPFDLPTLALATIASAAIVALGSALPAIRVGRVSPAEAMRAE